MKLRSDYLNPFQPFPERQIGRSDEIALSSIENNLSRAVFSALANAESPSALASFLELIGPSHSLQEAGRILRDTASSDIEIGLQKGLPRDPDIGKTQVLLIGISSSHDSVWTHDQRVCPTNGCPDAWIHVAGKLLIAFECKSDEHPLDATQVCAYLHALGLLTEHDAVHRPSPGECLTQVEAEYVQKYCAPLVVDAKWFSVVKALERLADEPGIGERAHWLCGQAATYIRWHIRPPYQGLGTILDWLDGPDTPDRRQHLRKLIDGMSSSLDANASLPGAITFAKAKGELAQPRLAWGAGSAVYVPLMQSGLSLRRPWLGAEIEAVLWFRFAKEPEQRIGIEYYLQAPGAHTNEDSQRAWNDTSTRHHERGAEFDDAFARWANQAPSGCRVIVSRVGFNGKKRNWHGGGVERLDEANWEMLTPKEAARYLHDNAAMIWRFPRVGAAEEVTSIPEAASLVRKAAVSLVGPLDIRRLRECGMDAGKIQEQLQRAVDAIKPGHQQNKAGNVA